MRVLGAALLGIATLAIQAPGMAQSPAAAQGADVNEAAKEQARSKYSEGVALVKNAQWSDALATFEAASKIYSNAQITLGMGACERALGRYVRARGTLERALDESAKSSSPLPEGSVVEAKGFIAEIDHMLAHVTVTVDPPEAAITVDGRPLAPAGATSDSPPLVAAGVLPPGPGRPPPAKTFAMVLDPGVHVVTLSRKGFTDAVVNKTLAPGSSTSLDLKLDQLPATLKVTASQSSAIVRVDESDVGPAPVDVLRPAGSYHVLVKREGFLPYSTLVTVQPGQEVNLRATLAVDKPSVLSRWWFWSGAAVVIAAGVLITYAATRPTPQPPPYDGGSANWVAKPSPAGFHF